MSEPSQLFEITWIAGMPRSGTSWFGQIFASHPDVRLKLCPLFSYSFKNAMTETSTRTEWEEFFAKVYETADEFMDQEHLRKRQLVPNFETKNPTPHHLVIKSNRYHHLLPRLITLGLKVKLVLIVRDPRTAIASWVNNPTEFPQELNPDTEWRSGACKKTGPGEFWGFDDWKLVTELFLGLAKAHASNTRLVRYEQLRDFPTDSVSEIFEWCGLSFHPQTVQFIRASQSSRSDNPRSVFRSPGQLAERNFKLGGAAISEIENEVANSIFEDFLDRRLAIGQ